MSKEIMKNTRKEIIVKASIRSSRWELFSCFCTFSLENGNGKIEWINGVLMLTIFLYFFYHDSLIMAVFDSWPSMTDRTDTYHMIIAFTIWDALFFFSLPVQGWLTWTKSFLHLWFWGVENINRKSYLSFI